MIRDNVIRQIVDNQVLDPADVCDNNGICSYTSPEQLSVGNRNFWFLQSRNEQAISSNVYTFFETVDSDDKSEAKAEVFGIPLADIDVVRGADDVEVLVFELEASESSSIDVKEVVVNLQSAVAAATNEEIAEVKLFQNGVFIDVE